ncbi:MAG TPA: hypothetical protein VFG59_21340 [Anaeromyxobacter sp.]|nr:hypothetical protein [Anaeromyxobacter sp.]
MAGTEAVRVGAFPRLWWGAIIAGVLLALATHVVLGLFGAALGLAAQPTESGALGVLAGFWALITPLVATILGAWLACRLAGQERTDSTNLHGVMVWSIGLIAGALFLTGSMASGAMSAGAASGGAGAIQRFTGQPPASIGGASAAAGAAKVAGGAAMAGLCGLLGAFIGAAIARTRREGKGLGWRIAIQRTESLAHRGDHGATRLEDRPEYPDRTYPAAPGSEARDVARSEGPGAPPEPPYQH